VNTRNGNVFTAIPIVGWSGRGPDMNMMLFHNSAAVGDTSFAQAVGFNLGPGWSISYSDHLFLNELPNQVTVVAANGTKNVFWWFSSQQRWMPPNGVYDELTQIGSSTWRLTHKDQSFHEFTALFPTTPPIVPWNDGIARLTRVVDATGNSAELVYEVIVVEGEPRPRLHSVTAAGRVLNFEYYGVSGTPDYGRLYNLVDPHDGDAGTHERKWTFQYYPPGDFDDGWLQHVGDAMQYKNRFTYDTVGRLASVGDKDNGSSNPYVYTYTDGRLTGVADPSGVGGGRTQQIAYACSQPSPFEQKTITTYTNRRGHTWTYTYPEAAPLGVPAFAGTLRSVQNPAGMSFYSFDGSFNLLWYTDANGNWWGSTYDPRGNRLTLTDPLNHVQTWTYDGLNNVTSHTDAAGNIVRYYYDNTTFPTMPTRIVEPNDGGNPQLGEENGFPVTRMNYYLTSGCTRLNTGPPEDDDYACRGQLMDAIDPNAVWTGFTYDQWGQTNRYREGKYTSATAGGDVNVYEMNNDVDSSGITIRSSSSGSGGGSMSHDSRGNPTSSTCIPRATASTGSGSNWPPFALPCSAPNLPERSAEFDATYSPKNELLTLLLNLDDDSVPDRTHTRTYDVMGRVKQSSIYSTEPVPGGVIRTFTYTYNVAAGTYTRTGPDGPNGQGGTVTTTQLDAADRVQSVERRTSPGSLLLMRANYTYLPNGLVESVTYTKTSGTIGPGASVHYLYDMANRVTQIEHRNAAGLAILRMDYTYTVNDLPYTIQEWDQLPLGQWSWRATTTFSYDRRNRLTSESRTGQNAYQRAYVYDAGGNRT